MSKRPVAVEDLFKISFLGQVEVSPCGGRAAYVVTVTDHEKDGYRSAIHVLDLATGESIQFTSGTHKDTQPKWAPDGSKIAFLSNRSGKNQLWVIEADGGEARQLTKLAAGASGHNWSPDGQYLAFTSQVKTGETPELEGADAAKKDKDKSDVRVITRLTYKANGIGFLGDARRHVFVVAVDGGDARQLTFGECDDNDPAWSPDGKLIAFAGNRTEDADYTRVRDIWVVPAVAGEPRQVTNAPGPSGMPVWSPDGATIYYLGNDQMYSGCTHTGIWAVPAAGGEGKLLTERDLAIGSGVTWDMTVGPTGTPYCLAGEWFYVSAAHHGQAHVFKVPVGGGKAEQVTAGVRNVISFSLSADGKVLGYSSATDVDPGQVYTLTGGTEKCWTKLNEQLLAEIDPQAPEMFWYKGADGWDCQGWVIKPPGFKAGHKYPIVLEIHGGPHSMFGHGFFHEFQYLAAQGWVVVYTNPRGSNGYGQEFTNACRNDWGGKDYEDIMLGLDHVIAQGYCDPDRLQVTGGSYGGFMTSWVVGHTDRFRSAVTQRSLTNRFSFYGTADIGPLFGESEFIGNPWDDTEIVMERSPITYVKNIKTPLLIIHSEQDIRCPMEQSEQLFVFLKRQRKPVEFVRFPDENHELSRSGKPKHRKERLERMAGWFKRYM